MKYKVLAWYYRNLDRIASIIAYLIVVALSTAGWIWLLR
jgi:hypothetical protein